MNDAAILYEDGRCRVTNSTLEIGGTSYPISKIVSVTTPMQLPLTLFGGVLLNAGLFILGLWGISTFSWLWSILGLAAAAIGGLNVWGEFHRPYWINVQLVNAEEQRIQRKKKSEIDGLYESLRTALE